MTPAEITAISEWCEEWIRCEETAREMGLKPTKGDFVLSAPEARIAPLVAILLGELRCSS